MTDHSSSGEYPTVPTLLLGVWVPGHPRTKGSLDTQIAGRRGSRQRVRVTDTEQSKRWRRVVAEAVSDVVNGRQPLDEPLMVRLTFYTPYEPTHRFAGDLDKLERNVYDALTDARVWTDDCMAVRSENAKLAARGTMHGPGVLIEVWRT